MLDIFSPLQLSGLMLPNRMLMAPMTRGRAAAGGVPTEAMAAYYAARAEAGLIISEAAYVSPMARGWNGAPGLYTDEQITGWRRVTGAVHAAGGRIFAQLWFLGRVSHPVFLDGATPWAPSALRAHHHVHAPTGERVDCVTPHEMTVTDIATAVADFAAAAARARLAGFDGVQIHAASGYLPDQFLRDGTNRRNDAYGGSIGNRLRFLAEITEACSAAIGAERVSVRLSPRNRYNDIDDSDPVATFGAAAAMLAGRGLAFLEVTEGLPGHFLHVEGPVVLPVMRAAFNGVLVANGGYDKATADAAIAAGSADAVALGIPFLSNPDLVHRFATNARLNAADPATFYTAGEPGYLDYPTLDQVSGEGPAYRALSLGEASRH